MQLPFDRDAVIAAFRAHRGRPLKAVDVSRWLEFSHERRAELRTLLRALVDQGDLVRVEGRRYALASDAEAHEGIVRLSSKGYGWFAPETPGVSDAFIPPDQTEELVDGDRVRARISPSAKGPVAQILRVLTRGRTSVVGVYHRATHNSGAVEVAPGVLRRPLIVEHRDGDPRAKEGDLVEAVIARYPTPVRAPLGHLVRIIGAAGSTSAEIERILEEHQVVRAFSQEALDEAGALPPAPSKRDLDGREDLRSLALCTIDGATAKDFDDAVHARPTGGNGVEVTVAIADVAHYVQPGSPLDEDARERGTSLYYPGKVVPMLPFALSNGLCSLRPEVERLCMVARFVVKPDGSVSKTRFANGVMRSKARLTYDGVFEHFEGGPLKVFEGKDGESDARAPDDVKTSLVHLREAARRLNGARRQRGMLDFNLAESVFKLDDKGDPVASTRAPRNEAHKLIEELMIAANEAVANHFFRKDIPCIYRVHEPPDPEKLKTFLTLARRAAKDHRVNVPKEAPHNAKTVGAILKNLDDTPLSEALNSLLLRAMMQAHYTSENVGHFSLASDAYLHFTSPIRRYPDLEVHRQLKRHLQSKKRLHDGEKDRLRRALEQTAKMMSDKEREAMSCERDISSLMATWVMSERKGELMEGRVTSVREFGAFVRVTPLHLDGLVPLGEIARDYLNLDEHGLRLIAERSGFSLGIGDRVIVEVKDADLSRRQTTFDLERVTEQMGREVNLIPTKRGRDNELDRSPRRRRRR